MFSACSQWHVAPPKEKTMEGMHTTPRLGLRYRKVRVWDIPQQRPPQRNTAVSPLGWGRLLIYACTCRLFRTAENSHDDPARVLASASFTNHWSAATIAWASQHTQTHGQNTRVFVWCGVCRMGCVGGCWTRMHSTLPGTIGTRPNQKHIQTLAETCWSTLALPSPRVLS